MSSASDDSLRESTEDLTSKPFKSLDELYSNLNNLKVWPEIKKLRKTTGYVYSGRDINNVNIPMVKLTKNMTPKTLVCHDMKGGYLDDRFINGSEAHDSYVFYHWSAIDTFVYFSHYFVTIPPYGWINAAHIHGVKILGTIITEWKEGAEIWDQVFKSEVETKRLADALIQIAEFYRFDGWLLNVENVIKKDDVEKLKFFVKYLNDNIHQRIIGSEIIWYDSVTCNGNLKWQNQLNDLNKQLINVSRCFFDVCDGIFLNYNWTDSGLAESCAAVKNENRIADIYVGLDVWGRGCPGGGGFHSDFALKKIREHNMSVAIFGAGWTHEHFGSETFEEVENLFWAQLFPYLYVHVPLFDNETFKTSFCRGAGLNSYQLGQRRIRRNRIADDRFGKDEPFYNLSAQCLQLSVPTPDSVFLSEEKKGISDIVPLASTLPEKTDAENPIELFLDPKTVAERKIKVYETLKTIVEVKGNKVLFKSKPEANSHLNYFEFCNNCSFNGGGCLRLIHKNLELYHRLFILQATFEHAIQVYLVYRIDQQIPDSREPVLVIGDGKELKFISKYKTEELDFPWRRNLYLTNFNVVTEIGVSAFERGIITLGEVIVEEKETGK